MESFTQRLRTINAADRGTKKLHILPQEQKALWTKSTRPVVSYFYEIVEQTVRCDRIRIGV